MELDRHLVVAVAVVIADRMLVHPKFGADTCVAMHGSVNKPKITLVSPATFQPSSATRRSWA
jgi:hypothetical protein